jgi:hypothetical protein
MSRRIRSLINAHRTLAFAALLLVGLAVALAGCDADSPSEPDQPPGTPPGGGPSNATYNITVSIDPPQVPAGSTDPVNVTVRVSRRDNGQPPTDGTTLVVTAAAGSFGSPGGGTSIVAQLFNGQASVAYFPPETQGTGQVTIQARLEGSVGQAVLRIQEPATFFIASVQPNSGSPNGGEPVTITGGGFEAPVRVTFGGVPAQVQSVTASRIRVLTPPSSQNVPVGGTATVPVQVTINLNEVDQAIDTLQNAFIYARGGSVIQPQVFSVTPASGPNDGGTRVTIVGEGFQAPIQVFFGSGTTGAFTGLEATVESVTPTRLVVVTPPAQGFGQNNLNEVVDILIRNLNSGFATVAGSSFQYGSGGANVPFISAVSPNQGPFTGGTLATLFGQGFDEPVSVTLAGVAASVISVTATEVVVRSSGVSVSNCGDVTGDVVLVNIETGESATGPDWIYRVTSPVITGATPSSGPQSGNTQVTVSGIDFQGPVAVSFSSGGSSFAASIQSVSATSIVVRTPAVANSALDTEACDDNGDGTNGERYLPTAFDIEVENLITSCSDSFAGAFIFTPSDPTCRGDVGPTEPDPVECEDGFDNDGDMLIDAADPECTGPGDDDESA